MNKKYLIITASYWDWHNAAKNSIKNYLEEKWEIVQVFDYFSDMIKFKKLSQKFYKLSSEKYPLIRKYFLKILELKIWNILAKNYFTKKYSKVFNKIINDFNPDFIISVFPISQYFIWEYKKTYKYNFKFWVVITDATVPYPWYFEDNYIDKFFVYDDSAKDFLTKKLPKRKNDIITSFFPLESKYFFNKSKLKNKIIAILLTSFSFKFSKKLLENLDKQSFYDEILIIKWRNDFIYEKLKSEIKNPKFQYLDYINIKENLKDIDIFITKPWWAIISECIAHDVYVITPFFIPWQEKENIDLLERNNLWFYSRDINKILSFLKEWHKNIDTKNFKKIKKINSIEIIIKSLKSK